MVETNIRIVKPGESLHIWTRAANVSGTDLTPGLVQKACGTLRYRHGLAAVPNPSNTSQIIVATKLPVKNLRLEEADWALEVTDGGQIPRRLFINHPPHRDMVADLVERALEATLATATDYWTFNSPSIWYEPNPTQTEKGIEAFRRYELGAVFIKKEGLGIKVDVGTAFFSSNNLGYYFDPNLPTEIQQEREKEFDKLRNRQEGQKGTLLYNNGTYIMPCYFELAPQGITCKTTGEIRLKSKSYASLADYYHALNPSLKFDENGRAIRVSFRHSNQSKGNNSSVWIAAELAKVRIINEDIPDNLSSLDKIDPEERRRLINTFWANIGKTPFGGITLGISPKFWRPQEHQVSKFPLPTLIFGNNQKLYPPVTRDVESYRKNYKQRIEYLNKYGCYDAPIAMTRTLHCAYPAVVKERGITDFANAVTETLQKWTNRPVQISDPLAYKTVHEATTKLSADDARAVVFIMNKEPLAYHDAAYEKPWRIKRITQGQLNIHHQYLTKGAFDRKKKNFDRQLGQSRWNSFVQMNALDILQLLEATPFCHEEIGNYEAQLAIDVGYDKRHFAISLLIIRTNDKRPPFCIRTDFQIVTGQKNDEINHCLLKDQIIETFELALGRRSTALNSLLILRDGKFWPKEISGVENALTQLKTRSLIEGQATIHLADLSKNQRKMIRLWEVQEDGSVENALEGTAVKLNENLVVLNSTGATVHQGTSQSITISSVSHFPDIMEAAYSAFLATQLNWSSPGVAQRLPLNFKNTDDELKARDAQEIRGKS